MQVIQLLKFSINNNTFYYTDAGSHYQYNNENYIAGFWEGIKSFEQRSAPAINEHTIKIDDPDLSLTNTIFAGGWQWRPLSIRWLILDETNTTTDDFLVQQSAITMHNTDDDKRSVSLHVQENHTLELSTGHRTNVASQHIVDPTDDGFEMIPFLDGIQLPWGKAGNGIVTVHNSTNQKGENFFRSPQHDSPAQE